MSIQWISFLKISIPTRAVIEGRRQRRLRFVTKISAHPSNKTCHNFNLANFRKTMFSLLNHFYWFIIFCSSTFFKIAIALWWIKQVMCATIWKGTGQKQRCLPPQRQKKVDYLAIFSCENCAAQLHSILFPDISYRALCWTEFVGSRQKISIIINYGNYV